jgi:hypothetical protein
MPITTTYMSLQEAQDSDNAETYLATYLAESLVTVDTHDHSSTKGVPVKRLQNGTFAARPAAGNAGHVYVASDDNRVFWDNGTSWIEAVIQATTNLVTLSGGLTLAGLLTLPSGTSYPASPSAGGLFYRSDMRRLDTYNGSGWAPAASSGAFMDPLSLVHL